MVRKFRVDPSVYLLLAIGVLTLPVSWLAGAVLAAVFHELCHCLTARRLGISCYELHVGAGGITLFLPYTTKNEELWIALAGPLGSFLLIALIRWYPQLSICACVQGLFNLLPIYPLDGGRILRCLLRNWETVYQTIEVCAILLLFLCAIICSIWFRLGPTPIMIAFIIFARALPRKIPCKAENLGVQ